MAGHYLALCCIAKDEEPILKEWLAYHSLLGVEHFYVYDNMSKRPIKEVLRGFAHPERVTVRRLHGEGVQVPAYNDCLRTFGAECRWIGFIDLDEFLFPLRDNDFRVVLSEFEQHAGLGLTWHLFNSSGHLKRPQGPVIGNYTEAFAEQRSYLIKSIVQPGKTAMACSPHHFAFPEGECCVNEDHYPIPPGIQFTFSGGRLARVNHYFVRSQQDFEEKLVRGRGDTAKAEKRHERIMFLEAVKKPYVKDTSALRFLPAVETALRLDKLPDPSPLLPAELPYETLMEMALANHESGRDERALACTCSADASHAEKADFWTLRTLLAMSAGNLDRADIFIRESLKRGPTEAGIRQLRQLFTARGLTDFVTAIDEVVNAFPRIFP